MEIRKRVLPLQPRNGSAGVRRDERGLLRVLTKRSAFRWSEKKYEKTFCQLKNTFYFCTRKSARTQTDRRLVMRKEIEIFEIEYNNQVKRKTKAKSNFE